MTIASAAGIAAIVHAEPDTTSGAAPNFLAAWIKAWNNHDAHALGELHTSNAITVNRFGTLVVGRGPTEKALGFLHSKQGPFGHSTFPSLRLLEARLIAPEYSLCRRAGKILSCIRTEKHPRGSGTI